VSVFVQENKSLGLEGSVRPSSSGEHSVLENISGQSSSVVSCLTMTTNATD